MKLYEPDLLKFKLYTFQMADNNWLWCMKVERLESDFNNEVLLLRLESEVPSVSNINVLSINNSGPNKIIPRYIYGKVSL